MIKQEYILKARREALIEGYNTIKNEEFKTELAKQHQKNTLVVYEKLLKEYEFILCEKEL